MTTTKQQYAGLNKRIHPDAITRLMRASKTTIRATSERMNVSMARVRRVREYGLNPCNCRDNVRGFALDWFEGITGSTEGFGGSRRYSPAAIGQKKSQCVDSQQTKVVHNQVSHLISSL